MHVAHHSIVFNGKISARLKPTGCPGVRRGALRFHDDSFLAVIIIKIVGVGDSDGDGDGAVDVVVRLVLLCYFYR